MLFGESMFVQRACNEINLTEVHCFIGETHLKFLACTAVDREVIVCITLHTCIVYVFVCIPCLWWWPLRYACLTCLLFVVFISCLLD